MRAVIPPPASATACIMIAASVMPSPEPPYAFGHGDAQPAGLGHRAVEFVREFTASASRSSQ